MIQLLAKCWIKDYENYKDINVRNQYGMLCGVVGIALNILLFAGKFIAGLISNSIAITADAFNNLSDAGSSLITLFGFKLAAAKPDAKHPFGHGRIEYISGLIVSGIIVVMGVELFKESLGKILHPQETSMSLLVLAILLISILVKIYMAIYNMGIAKKINSAAMKATGTDSLSDTIATTVVLISAIVGHLTGLHIDGFCGVLVAVFILYAGFSAGKETIEPLLGQPAEPEFVQELCDIVESQDGIIGMHDVMVHNYGPGRVIVSLHAEVPASTDIMVSHDIVDNTEKILHEKLHCEAVIHMDPVVNDDPKVAELKAVSNAIIKEIDNKMTLHDFRTVPGNTHTNVLFDVVVPFECEYEENDLQELIQKKMTEKLGNHYFAVIHVDKPYVS